MARSKTAPRNTSADTSAGVDDFMSGLQHPQKPAIEALRKVVRGADASIAEGVKWNAPSFRTSGYFATTHLRAKSGIGLILHLGAKARDIPAVRIEDPDGLLTWLAKDRAMASFAGLEDLRARESALQGIVRQWLKHL